MSNLTDFIGGPGGYVASLDGIYDKTKFIRASNSLTKDVFKDLSWAQKTSGATARRNSTSVIYQDKMYIFGGWDGSSYFNDMWEYDITNDA